MTSPDLLPPGDIEEWPAQHSSWQRRDGHLVRELTSANYGRLAQLVHDQSVIVELFDHHPVITLAFGRLLIELWTHDRRGLTQLDLDYASAFDQFVGAHFNDLELD